MLKKILIQKNELPIVLQKKLFFAFRDKKLDLIFVKLRRKKVS